MEIDINQRKIAVGFKYDIFCQEKQIRFAQSQLFRFMTHIDLLNVEGGNSLLTLVQRFSFLYTSYDILFPGGYIAEFRTESIWKGHNQCKYGQDVFDIYSHRSRKHSIYKNGCQIAWWDQKAVTWFEGDNYKILADDNCDIDIIIAFCLILDDSNSNNSDGATVTFRIGHIGPQAKEFDQHWRPNAGRTG